MTTPRVARVALPLPVADPYRYIIPTALADRALPGARVVVPVRLREMLGIITSVSDEPAPANAREKKYQMANGFSYHLSQRASAPARSTASRCAIAAAVSGIAPSR